MANLTGPRNRESLPPKGAEPSAETMLLAEGTADCRYLERVRELSPGDPRRTEIAAEILRNPESSRISICRAIVGLCDARQDGDQVLLDAWRGKYKHLDARLREHAAAALLHRQPDAFTTVLEALPRDDQARLIGTRALGRDLSMSSFQSLVRAISPESEQLTRAALGALHSALNERKVQVPWPLRRAEGVLHCLRFAEATGLGDPSAACEDSQMFRKGSRGISSQSLMESDHRLELREALKSVVRALSDGFDETLVAYLRNAKTRAACAIPLEILAERNSPETHKVLMEIVNDRRKDPAVLELLADCKQAISSLAKEIRDAINGDLAKQCGDLIRRLGLPLPGVLDPEKSQLRFGILHRILPS